MISISDDLKLRLKNLINEHAGLYFKDYALKDLEIAISQRMAVRRIALPVDYFNLIAFSEEKESEFRELLNLLTINHTYFFRNEAQFKILKEKILPEIIARKMNNAFFTQPGQVDRPSLRIWSAGSSTGEEPYTIAMLVKEAILDLENWDIQILATDASQNALEHARKGVFGPNSFKNMDERYLQKYFTPRVAKSQRPQYEIQDDLKSMVSLGYFNLMDEDYPRNFDVIFFRNVSIYFELETTIKVMQKMHTSLRDDGYLFIGYSETLQFMPDKFKMFCQDEAIYYRKNFEKAIAPQFAPKKDEGNIEKALEEISLRQALAEVESELKKAPTPKKLEDILVDAVQCFHGKEYDKALKLLGEAQLIDKNSIEPFYISAEIFLSQGKLNEAKAKLTHALTINPLFAAAHYLFGCVFLEQNLTDPAKESLKKALYLDKDFSLAHFYLAQAYKVEAKTNDAIREYRNTAKLLSRLSAEDIIPFSGGFNAATILSVCRDNIERLKFENL
ncbi:MAG: hypothetical protein NT079_05955 [Candidatus Omnitrophica bacterium]|nr:hypothetical protein [Candidatus Omnitrophota bacterium]